MGKARPRKNDINCTEDELSEETGRKLVASILDDDKHGRFKVLVRGHSKKAIITYREKETTLSLLQFACIVGNVQAAEVLLGLGADKNICWDYSRKPGGWDVTDVKWLPPKAQTCFAAKSENICDTDPPMCIQPLHAAKLSILHLAALANQLQMVSFLVNKEHLPVDIRAGATGVTPLLAVATKRCCWLEGVDRYEGHTCGHPRDGGESPLRSDRMNCVSMLLMFDHLLKLGADKDAVDVCGCDWLAAAAAAGDHGLWDELVKIAVDHIDELHPELVLHRAAQYSCSAPGGRASFFSKAVDCMQRQLEARGDLEDFVCQLSNPAADLVPDGRDGWSVQPSHALLAAMVGHRGEQVVVRLLELGVPLNCLCEEGKDLPIGCRWSCPVQNVLAAAQHLMRCREPPGDHGRLLMALFFNSCLCKYPADALADVSKDFAELAQLMQDQGLDFREQRWWPDPPAAFSSVGSGSSEIAPLHGPPLIWAIRCSCTPALEAQLELLRTLGDTAYINRTSPSGSLPLVLAAYCADARACQLLLDAGADVMGTDAQNCSALWEAVGQLSMPGGEAIALALVKELVVLHADERHRAAVLNFLHRPCIGDVTLAQWMTTMKADYLLCLLAQTGMQMNLTYTNSTPLRMACQRPQTEDARNLLIKVLVNTPNEALTKALKERSSDHGLTLLGQAIAWGDSSTYITLMIACRRDDLEVAPLLERHTERSRFHAPLFAAIVHKYPRVLETLVRYRMQLTPEVSAEHLLLSAEAQMADRPPRGREFVREPRPGETESLSLLMCAASVGNLGAVRLLMQAGVRAREEPFPCNRWYKNALTAAIDFPDLAGFPGSEGSSDGSTSNMGRNQLACVRELLKAGGAMTEDQMYKMLDAVYHATDSQVGTDLFSFMSKQLAQCRRCKLVGRWHKCAGCQCTFYCGIVCQAADWPEHHKHCRPPKAEVEGIVLSDLTASAAQLDLRT